jgi:hypothetical protein
MTRTHDLVLVWNLDNRAWIDRCFRFFSTGEPLWRRSGAGAPGCLFEFVHSGGHSDSLLRRLPPRTEVRVAAFASHDLVVTVSPVRGDVFEMLSAYEVANRIGASTAPPAATGIMGAQCRSAFLVRRLAHLTAADVEPFVDNDVVRPELNRVHAAQRQQYAGRGYATAADPVLFLEDDAEVVVPVDAAFFARDPQPRPRAVHGTPSAPARSRTTRTPAKPLLTRLLEARPPWLTSELAASATQLRMYVALLQDKGSAATKVHLGDPTQPGTECVALPVYVPMTDEADGELTARLQRVTWFAETAEVQLRRRCATCRRSSVAAPSCRTTRSRTSRTRTVLSVAGRSTGGATGVPAGLRRGQVWSCGRCPGARFEEDTVFVCPPCGGVVSQLDAMDCCPHCGFVPG